MGAASVISISKDVGRPSEYLQVLGAQVPYLLDLNNASATVQLGDFRISEDEVLAKVRKPYTVTKQREKWTEGEHQRFLEALKLYGRGWRQIEEHIGTKNAVQIRSHAQKFFSKLEREQATGGYHSSSVQDIHIPPARPKRKPNHPYPRKAAAAGQAAITASTRQNCLASATDMFSSKASTGCVVAQSCCQNAVSTSSQFYSTRKESDQMQTGGIMNPLLCNSAGLKIFGQTFAPGIQSSADSEQTMLDSDDACANDMSAAKDCGRVVKEACSFSESINCMQSAEDRDIRRSPRDKSVESTCASNAVHVKISDEETVANNSIKEASCITKEKWTSKESFQSLKTASKANDTEEILQCKFPRASSLILSDGSCHQPNLCTSILNCCVGETVDAAAMATLAAASAWWASQESMAMGISNDHDIHFNAPHLSALHSAASLALTNTPYSLNGKEASTLEFLPRAGTDMATLQLQDPKANFKEIILFRGENTCHLATNTNLTISDQNIRTPVPSSSISSDCDAKNGLGGSTGKDFSAQGKCIESELGKSHYLRLSPLSECIQSTFSLAVGKTPEHTLSNSNACHHLKKQINSFSSHGEQLWDEHKKMSSIKDQTHSEVGIVERSSIDITGDLLPSLEQQHCCKEDEQIQSRVAPRNSAAHGQVARDKRSKRLKDCNLSFMDNYDAQREGLIRISNGDLPCAETRTHIKILDLVTRLEEENEKASQVARDRSTPSPDSVLKFDEGLLSPSRKRTRSFAVGFQPYQASSQKNRYSMSSSSNE